MSKIWWRRTTSGAIIDAPEWRKPTGFVCFAPALREHPGGCGSADHPKLPERPRLCHARNRLFGSGFAGLGYPISRPLAAYCVCLEPRPLPSTGITRLLRYYGPLRHLEQPGTSLAGVPLKVTRLHCFEASRVASDFLCRHAGAYTPAESGNAFVARFFPDDGLPRFDIGSASAMSVSRLQWRSR